jgi:hypothetical protein
MRQIARRQDHCAKPFAASCLLGLACEQKRIMRNRDIMSKLTWIVSVLLCAGCVVSQPAPDDKAATVGKPVESVEKTISENSSPAPVAGQAATVSRPITRPNPQPVKTSSAISPASPNTEGARIVKTDAAPTKITNEKAQTVATSASTSIVKREEPPANILIKGTPKETKPESSDKSFGNKLKQKGAILAVGGIAVAMSGWVFVRRNGKPQAAKGKNLKGKSEAAADMEKAWKKGGVF